MLANVDEAARLEWRPWSVPEKPPSGSVSVDRDVFVASPGEDKLKAGGLYTSSSSFAAILAVESAEEAKKGLVLVEVEAVRYEIGDFFRGRQTRQSQRNVNVPLTSVLESRPSSEDDSRIYNVTFETSLYLGRGQGIPTGAEVKLAFRNGSEVDLLWGEAKTELRTRQIRLRSEVEKPLVSISAMQIARTFDFTASISAVYADGLVKRRKIRGRMRSIELDLFAPRFEVGAAIDYRIREKATSSSTTTTTTTSTRPPTTSRRKTATMVKSYRYPVASSNETTSINAEAKRKIQNELRTASTSKSTSKRIDNFVMLIMGLVMQIRAIC